MSTTCNTARSRTNGAALAATTDDPDLNNYMLTLDPAVLREIDELAMEYAALDDTMELIREKYNDIASVVRARTQAGHTEPAAFVDLHEPIRQIAWQLESLATARRELDAQKIRLAWNLPDVIDPNEGGCIHCLDVESTADQAEASAPAEDVQVLAYRRGGRLVCVCCDHEHE